MSIDPSIKTPQVRLLRPLAIALAGAALISLAPAASAADSFAACLAQLRGPALKAGVSGATFDTHTAGLAPDMAVIDLLDAQPEFKTPIWDYMAALVDDERVSDGQAGMARWQSDLDRAASRYGVDAATIAAVWGVESNYGRTLGGRPLLTSLSTLSCYGRRQAYFRGEFFSTLKIIQDEHIAPERLTGSWAGAFGQTQFMPSTYLRLAVDFDGDGRRDLVDSVPDALASTANFLKRAGWSAALGVNNVFDKRTRKVPEYARSATDVASIETTWDTGDVLSTVGAVWYGRVNYRF